MADRTLDEMYGDLEAAHGMNDAALATRIANAIRTKQGSATATPAQPRSELSLFRALEHADDNTPTAAAAAAAVKPAPVVHAPDVPSAADTFDPTAGMDTKDKLLAGVGGAMNDKWLGARQFANAATGGWIGDKDALAAEAAEKKRLDAPLLATGAGRVGDLVGSLVVDAPLMVGGAALVPKVLSGVRKLGAVADAALPSLMPRVMASLPRMPASLADLATIPAELRGVASEVVKRSPSLARIGEVAGNIKATMPVTARAAPFIAKVLPSVASSAGTGAALQQLTPDQDYSIAANALHGGIAGAAGDVIGRGLGRVVKPVRTAISDTTEAALGRLRAAGLLEKPIATNMFPENEVLQAATSAMAKTPFLGSAIRKNQEEALANLTQREAARAGMPGARSVAEAIGTEAQPGMRGRLVEQIEQFKGGPEVPLPQVFGDVAKAAETARMHAGLSGQSEGLSGIATKLEDRLTTPGATGMMSAKDALALRSSASTLAHETEDPVLALQWRAYRDSLDNAIKGTHPDKGKAFDTWRKEWSAMEDFAKSASRGRGTSAGDHLLPSNVLAVSSKDAKNRALPLPGSEAQLLHDMDRIVPDSLVGGGIATPVGRIASAVGMGGAAPLVLAGAGLGAYGNSDNRGEGAIAGALPVAGASALLAALLGPQGARYIGGQHAWQRQAILDALRQASQAGTVELTKNIGPRKQ